MKLPISIGDIVTKDPDVLARVILLAADTRMRQIKFFSDRSRQNLGEAKASEKRLDIALSALTKERGLL